MKRISAVLLALVICMGFSVSALADGHTDASLDHFTQRVQYADGQFSDVDESAWYGSENQASVKTACELGIMNGMGDGTFLPGSPIRLCEAIKMAAVVHSIYNGGDGQFDVSNDPWYEDCVNDAIQNGIIAADDFSDYTAFATRAELAAIFANTLPASELPAINTVNSISDVFTSSMIGIEYSASITALYRAGVLTGDAGTHDFRPDDTITRAETAAIISRLAVAEQRQRFEILTDNADVSAHPAYAIYNSNGGCLMLGYQPGDAVQKFFNAEPISTQVWQHKDDTKLFLSQFTGADDVRYLKSDLAGGGIYVFALGITGEDYKLANGIHCGSTEEELKAAYGDGELGYEDHRTEIGGYWGDADSTYTYYPGDASPWSSISFDIKGGAVASMMLSCSIY